jgi:anti-sigma factor RsiW
MARCSRVLSLLVDYLEGRLAPMVEAGLERHLSSCSRCVAYVNSYRSTVSLLHSLTENDLPPELRLHLTPFIDHASRN